MFIRLVGDVHGKIDEYINIVKDCNYSIQLGDLGFDYTKLSKLDPSCHKVLAGNHDNYNRLTEHFLGDYGGLVSVDSCLSPIFFIRGGLSIDKAYRTEGLNWWSNEELTYTEMCNALDAYIKVRPPIVISHECPSSITPILKDCSNFFHPSSTSSLLNIMLENHKPMMWFFGHHHISFNKVINGTKFVCLNELEYFDLKV